MDKRELGYSLAKYQDASINFQGERSFRIPYINFRNKTHPFSRFLPKFLFALRTHGDEPQYREFVELLEEYAKDVRCRLPHFTLIPVVSISASRLGTRENIAKVDMNRAFKSPYLDGEDPEVVNVAQIIRRNGPFDVVVTGHQGGPEGYFYQQGTIFSGIDHDSWRRKTGRRPFRTRLYNGVDDPEDCDLGYFVERGIATISNSQWDPQNSAGFLEGFGLKEGDAKTAITLESPVSGSRKQRYHFYEAFFDREVFSLTNKILQENIGQYI